VNPRRLYRSRTDRQISGVAGGMAEYLDVDPTLVRVLWILSVFLGGFTILLYIILAFVMPLAPESGYPAGRGWSPAWGPAQAPAWGPAQAPVAGDGTSGAADGTSGAADGTSGAADGTGTGAATDPSPTQGWDTSAWTAGMPGAAGAAGAAGGNWAQGGWAATAGAAPTVEPRRGPSGAVIAGVLLVVFGTIALADSVIPGLVAGAIMGPALILALGAALLVTSMRRRAGER
jgi:phage shock protein PspC (stress-responsive transcriptional regulator)